MLYLGYNRLFTITWGCFSRRGRLSAGAKANTMFVMKVMPHGRGVYHLPQASPLTLWGLDARAFPIGVPPLFLFTYLLYSD